MLTLQEFYSHIFLMKRICTVLLLFISCVGNIRGEQFNYNYYFTPYTSENGLSQNSITDILKDSKGFLWVGTRDGLNKFDGYNFKIFNSRKGKNFEISNDRIRKIEEDSLNFIWIKTYDDIVYRLNPSTEKLTKILSEEGGYIEEKIKDIIILSKNEIYLTTFSKGCYEVTYYNNEIQRAKYISGAGGHLPDDDINAVFKDKQGNTWFITEKGLACRDVNRRYNFYFQEYAFYAYEETKDGIWFGSRGVVFNYDKKSKNFRTIPLSYPVPVIGVAALPSGHFLFATKGSGFYTYHSQDSSLNRYDSKEYPQLKSDEILGLYIDRKGEAWMGVDNQSGVIHFNPENRHVEYLESQLNYGQSINPNYIIFEDLKGVLWVQPHLGNFSYYDRSEDKLIRFQSQTNNDINDLFSYGVNHIYPDKQGIFWMSTNRGNGFYKCVPVPDYSRHILFSNNSLSSISNDIRSVFQDRDKRIWAASKDGRLHVLDESRKETGLLDQSGRISNDIPLNVLVYDIFQDKQGNIWLATKKQGIYKLIPTPDRNKFRIENFQHKKNDPYSPGNNDFYSIVEDLNGNVWAGSYGAGLHLIRERNGRVEFVHHQNELKKYPIENYARIRCLYPDSKGNIWIGTTDGLVVFKGDALNPLGIYFDSFQKKVNDTRSLSSNDIHCVIEDKNKKIWVGTFGGGLNKISSEYIPGKRITFERFDETRKMPNNVIYRILEDKDGMLWISSENLIIKMFPENYEMESFGKRDELGNLELSEGAACYLQSGELCFGSKSGLYFFIPEKTNKNPGCSSIIFTRFLLSSKEVVPGETGSPLTTQINDCKEIKLTHQQNAFTIEYADLDMRMPESVEYAYMLEGFEEDWNIVKNKRSATYTALPPGEYMFKVKSSGTDGIWMENERFIRIEILPSFGQSIWSKMIYIVLILGLFAGVILFTVRTVKKRMSINEED